MLSQNCEERPLASLFPSVDVEQFSTDWTDFDEI
jgi:hypothetical protein